MIPEIGSRLRAGSAWALAALLVALVFSLLRTIAVARVLEPADIGLMGIALLALGFAEAMATSGVDTALVAEREDPETYIDPAFTIQVARGLLLFGLLWIAAPSLARAFRTEAAIGIIRSVATIAVLRGFANPAAVYAVRRLDFRRVFWWSLPEVLATFGLTVALTFMLRDVRALVIGSIGGQVVATLASYGLLPRMPRFVLHVEGFRHLLRFGKFVSGSRALMYASVNLDSTIVGLTMGTQSLGLYQFATRVAELPVLTFTRAASQVALPVFSGLRADPTAVRVAWRTMLRWVLAVNGVAAITIVAVADWGVRVAVGDRWLDAVPVMRILALAMVCRSVTILAGQLLDALGQPARTLHLNAVRFAGLLTVVPLLAAWAGLIGVAQAVLLANAAAALLAFRISRHAVVNLS